MVGGSPQKTPRATTALSIFFVLFTTCTEVGANLRYEAVRDVIDGDTIVLQSGERVRLAGINTPELGRDGQLSEPLAKEASSTLRDLIGGQLVGLEEAEDPLDRYGRTLAHLYNSAGQNLQRQLLLKGLASAVAISPNLRHLDEYISAETTARANNQGMWILDYYRASSVSMIKPTAGYTFVYGQVQRVELTEKWFLFALAKKFVVLVPRQQWKRYFDYKPCSLDRAKIAVRGWVSMARKRYRLVINHPFMLERCGHEPTRLCPSSQARSALSSQVQDACV